MLLNKPDFKLGDFNTVCRDLCSEARQKIWQSNPEVYFEVNGKVLKAKQKNKNVQSNTGQETASNQQNIQQHIQQQIPFTSQQQ